MNSVKSAQVKTVEILERPHTHVSEHMTVMTTQWLNTSSNEQKLLNRT